MKLHLAALVLGVVSGFTVSWARMSDPRTFHAMLSLDSPRIYVLMASAVAVAFVGARLLRGRRALLTGEPVNWVAARPLQRSAAAACSRSSLQPACSSASSSSRRWLERANVCQKQENRGSPLSK